MNRLSNVTLLRGADLDLVERTRDALVLKRPDLLQVLVAAALREDGSS